MTIKTLEKSANIGITSTEVEAGKVNSSSKTKYQTEKGKLKKITGNLEIH